MNIIIATGGLGLSLTIILLQYFGITGAAIGSAISVIITNITAAVFIKHKYGYFISYIPFISKAHVKS